MQLNVRSQWRVAGGGGCGGGGGMTAHIVVYRDVRKIRVVFFVFCFFFRYGCVILAKIIYMAIKIVIFKLKNVIFWC